MVAQPVRAAVDVDGHQVVDIVVDRGYRPDAIVALAGIPLRLVFRRDDDDACSERVVFSSPRLDRRLAATGSTTIDLPAQPPGEVRFTCGMGRYRGRIELITDRAPSIRARLRRRAGRLESPLGTALVMWICSLPLIAVAVVLAFNTTAAIAAAGVALVAWVAGCVRAAGRGPGRLRGGPPPLVADQDLILRSVRFQPAGPGSTTGPDDPALNGQPTHETRRHDQHSAHSYH